MAVLQNFDSLTWEIYLHTGFFCCDQLTILRGWTTPAILRWTETFTANRAPRNSTTPPIGGSLLFLPLNSMWNTTHTFDELQTIHRKIFFSKYEILAIHFFILSFSYLYNTKKTANSLTQWADQSVILPLCLANIKSIFINSTDRRSWIKCWKFRGGGAE